MPLFLASSFPAVNAMEFCLYQFICSTADVYPARLAAAFHFGGGVNGIAPDIVRNFFDAYNASSSYYRTIYI